MNSAPEFILFGISVGIQALIIFLIYQFKDLIKIGLLFRRELSSREMLKMDKKKMRLIVDRLIRVNEKMKEADF